jgi:hypothetical protein
MSDTHLQDAVRRIIECYWHPTGIGPVQRFDERTTSLAWADLRMSLGVEQLHTPMPKPEVAVPVDTPDPAYWEPGAPNNLCLRLKENDRVRVKTTGEMATFHQLLFRGPPTSINKITALITLDTGPYMGHIVHEPLDNLEKV